jgi:hypothetical protein
MNPLHISPSYILSSTLILSRYLHLDLRPYKAQWQNTEPIIMCSNFLHILQLFFSVAQQPKSGLDRLIVEVSRSYTIRHTRTIRLLWTSDQPVAETATYTTHNRRTSMPLVGFETAILAIKQMQTYALDCKSNGIGFTAPSWS